MHVNAGPWAGLLMSLPLKKLFLLSVVLLVLSVGAVFSLEGTALRLVGPFAALAGGIGGAGLILLVFRLVMLGGPTVRTIAGAVTALGVLFGLASWYALGSVQRNARGACYEAARGMYPQSRKESLAEGQGKIGGVFFALAQALDPDPSIEEDCRVAAADLPRIERGDCPRWTSKYLGECSCGGKRFPRDLPYCDYATCKEEGAAWTLSCSW